MILIIFFMGISMLLIFSFARPIVLNYSLVIPDAEKKTAASLSYGEQPALSSPDFFKKVKDELLNQKTSFIEANLSQMKLFVYQEGNLSSEFPILTKGKEGSWWETPAGIYKIATKEKNHFSSFGHVYQPWSMAFQGNFFIHGWPYYDDGTPVASTYSGGCIRLSDKSAEAVFGMAKVGMPILVFKEDFIPDSFAYQKRAPDITAQKYLAADIKNNFVFLEKSKTEPVSFFGFSEILSDLVATDYINIEKSIPLNESTLSGVSHSRLSSGDKTTPFDLLHLSLRLSDENILRIFSNYLTEKRFIPLMNDKAEALGMKNTTFDFSAGESTPEDLFYLSKYIYNNRKFIFDISAGRKTNSSYAKSSFADVENENIFAGDPSFVGGKVIKNKDGTESFFGVFEVPAKVQIRPIFIFIGNGTNIKEEVPKILDYIKSSYQ